jgi:hypothetical protein
MAKKRKKEKKEEEEYEFTPPEFDEKEFLEKEMRDTRTILFTVGYGAVYGATAAAISIVDSSYVAVGLVLLLVGLFSLKYVYPIFKINVQEFAKKNWAGNIAWFFFTFLAIWVLLFNVPFSDHADPDIKDLTVWVHNNTTGNYTAIDWKQGPDGLTAWIPRDGGTLATLIRATANYTVNITAAVADNGELESVKIAIGVPSGYTNMTDQGESVYGREVSGVSLNPSTGLMFYIQATDEAGNYYVFYPTSPIPVAS